MPATERRSAAVERATQVGFAMVDKHVIWDESLPQNVKSVYTYLATYCGNTRTAFPSKATIAKHTGMSVRSVDKAVKIAKDCGLFLIQHQETGQVWKSNVYLLRDFGGGYEYGAGPLEVKDAAEGKTEGDPELEGGTAPPAVPPAPPAVGTAPDAHYQDQVSRPEIKKTSSLTARPHADAGGRKVKAAKTAKPRQADHPASDDWMTPDDPDHMVAAVLAHVDQLYGAPDGLEQMLTAKAEPDFDDEDYVIPGSALTPTHLMNLALKAARWGTVDFAAIKAAEKAGYGPDGERLDGQPEPACVYSDPWAS